MRCAVVPSVADGDFAGLKIEGPGAVAAAGVAAVSVALAWQAGFSAAEAHGLLWGSVGAMVVAYSLVRFAQTKFKRSD